MAAAAAPDDTVEGLRDVFRCFICMQQLHDARLCPHCSKFCCYQCIRRWILEQRAQCPHCRCGLRLSDLVKCRWAEEVTQKLDSIDTAPPKVNDDRDNCDLHAEKLSVYCCNCQNSICHHCALWGGQHTGHTLKPLEDEYNQRVAQINQEVRKLRRRLCQLISGLQELEKNIEGIRCAKEERVREIRCVVELMIARLDSQMKSKLVSLTGQKRSLSMEVEMIEGILSEVEHQLVTSSHGRLVRGSTELFRMVQQIQHSAPTDTLLHVPADFVSEIVPQYEGHMFVLKPFSELRRKADPVYSSTLVQNALSWRLKVYPDGNGVVRGNYISVFLELTQGTPEQAKYEYRVEMIHQLDSDPTRNIVREFASDFEAGECWGYNRFFKIEFLASEGFLHPVDDSLVLQFQVRPPTYYQKCKDLSWHVSVLESNQAHYVAKINELKEQISAQQTNATASEDAHVVVEEPPPTASSVETNQPLIEPPDEDEQILQVELEDVDLDVLPASTERTETETESSATATNRPDALERDVDDQMRLGTSTDVQGNLAAVSGLLADELDRVRLTLPEREHRQEATANRQTFFTLDQIQRAFRSNTDDSSDESVPESDWRLNLELHDEVERLDCPACSPRSKQLFRQLRSRHRDVLRDVNWYVRHADELSEDDLDDTTARASNRRSANTTPNNNNGNRNKDKNNTNNQRRL